MMHGEYKVKSKIGLLPNVTANGPKIKYPNRTPQKYIVVARLALYASSHTRSHYTKATS